MTNENLNPPEISDLYELFFDNNIDEAEGLVLEDILDNDNTDFVTMEQLPGGLDAKKAKEVELLKRKAEREGNKDLLFRAQRLTHSLNRK